VWEEEDPSDVPQVFPMYRDAACRHTPTYLCMYV